MPMPTDEALKWVFGGTTSAGLLALAIRFATRLLKSDKLDALALDAEMSGYIRQQAEIDRLYRKCVELEAQISEMQDGLSCRREYELANAGDIAVLGMLIDQLPCQKCAEQTESFKLAKLILARISARSYGNKEHVE